MIAATRRAIGGWGTPARGAVGVVLVGSMLHGHTSRGGHPAAWVLGLLAFPTVGFLIHAWRTRRHPAPLRAVGPGGHALTVASVLALYLTWRYAPAVDELSDAALLFYRLSMLLAAARGYAGYEVLAVSTCLLGRDDQIGCAAFWPIDAWEARDAGRIVAAAGGPGDG